MCAFALYTVALTGQVALLRYSPRQALTVHLSSRLFSPYDPGPPPPGPGYPYYSIEYMYFNTYSTIPTEGALAPATRLNTVKKTGRLHEVETV